MIEKEGLEWKSYDLGLVRNKCQERYQHTINSE